MKNYSNFKKEILKNKDIKKAYDKLELEFGIAALLIKRRFKQKITQRQLAELVGTKQSAISRFESGTYNPSVSFLYKIAEALDAELKISVSSKYPKR